MKRIDLNVDIGEGFPYDDALLELATSANVCCGEHAGSWELTMATIDKCLAKGVRVGMHPGFPDRASMGRALMTEATGPDWYHSIPQQAKRFLRHHRPAYFKPHGALYTMPMDPAADPKMVEVAIGMTLGLVIGTDLPLMILPSSPQAAALAGTTLPIIAEGFADRALGQNGWLVPRSQPGAVLEDPDQVREQTLRVAPGVDSICLHGDTPGCLEFAELVRKTLVDAGYEVGA